MYRSPNKLFGVFEVNSTLKTSNKLMNSNPRVVLSTSSVKRILIKFVGVLAAGDSIRSPLKYFQITALSP